MNPASVLRSRTDRLVLTEVKAGLQQDPKHLPCKLFYDELGAELFEEITTLPEYYPTRAELGILEAHGGAMADWIGAHARIVEFGSGSGNKTRVLLGKLKQPGEYIPIDIAEPQLLDFVADLARDLPAIRITPIPGDYTKPITLPQTRERTVVFFPGSTIGNFEPHEALAFLRNAHAIAGPRGGLLIGVDLRKDRATLERAYNDAAGVTAAFNLNILAHVNRVCDADFDLEAFTHRAIYDETHGRIEMHLVSERSQSVTLDRSSAAPARIKFNAGESIITEYSYKYSIPGFQALAAKAGFNPAQVWTDPDNRFSVHAFDVT